jgi:hypothetical protein
MGASKQKNRTGIRPPAPLHSADSSRLSYKIPAYLCNGGHDSVSPTHHLLVLTITSRSAKSAYRLLEKSRAKAVVDCSPLLLSTRVWVAAAARLDHDPLLSNPAPMLRSDHATSRREASHLRRYRSRHAWWLKAVACLRPRVRCIGCYVRPSLGGEAPDIGLAGQNCPGRRAPQARGLEARFREYGNADRPGEVVTSSPHRR